MKRKEWDIAMYATNTYCNPVPFSDGKRHTNPDPYVLKWCGKYYCYATDEHGVKVSVSKDLVHWEYKGYAIREEGFRDYWAPAVLYLDGIFYMYYSNIPAEETDNHEEHLKLAVSKHPEGVFEWKKTFFDKFSIDAHPILWQGNLYLFYSVNDWIGTEERVAGTCIVADQMVSPEEFAGNPKAVVLPTLPEEIFAKNRFGEGQDWHTIEGAAPLVRGSRFWLLYSANAYVNVDYYVGTALAACKENFMDMEWKKYPADYICCPLLKRNELVEGTGHNTVAKAPNMADDWIVYHGRNAKETLTPGTEQREMHIDPLYFNGDELLCFGPTASAQKAPGMPQIQLWDLDVTDTTMFGQGSPYYEAELWVSAKHSHMGARYGIYLQYHDSNHYLEAQVSTGKQELSVISARDGVRSVLAKMPLSKKDGICKGRYDYTAPHLFRLAKLFGSYTITLEGGEELRFTEPDTKSCGTVGIRPYFSELTVHSFALTRTALFMGQGLKHLGKFFELSPCALDEEGILPLGQELSVRPKETDNSYTEVFSFQIQKADNRILLHTAQPAAEHLLASGKTKEFSLYHIVDADGEHFLADGKKIELDLPSPEGRQNSQMLFYGLKLTEYQYTKNDSN